MDNLHLKLNRIVSTIQCRVTFQIHGTLGWPTLLIDMQLILNVDHFVMQRCGNTCTSIIIIEPTFSPSSRGQAFPILGRFSVAVCLKSSLATFVTLLFRKKVVIIRSRLFREVLFTCFHKRNDFWEIRHSYSERPRHQTNNKLFIQSRNSVRLRVKFNNLFYSILRQSSRAISRSETVITWFPREVKKMKRENVFKPQIMWPELLAQIFVHGGSIYGFYYWFTLQAQLYTFVWCELWLDMQNNMKLISSIF